MKETQAAFLNKPHDLARLKNAVAPALEFLSTALKAQGVIAFVMDPAAGRLDIASLNVPAALRSVDTDLGVFDHGLLRSAAPQGKRRLLVRSGDLERNKKTDAYLGALKAEGLCEVGEFQFHDSGMFIGGITLFWRDETPALIDDEAFLQPLHDFVQSSLLHSWRRTAVGRRHVLGTFLDLTARECDVLEMLCLGRTNQDAALCLGIRVPTVKTHLARLFDKFEVENRSALIRRALLSIDNIEAAEAMTQ